jgi:hypothetical protein
MWGISYAVYVLLSAAVLGIRHRKSPRDMLFRLTIVSLLPVVGWLFPIFWPKSAIRSRDEQFDDYVKRQQEEHKVRGMGIYARTEKQKELDVIPIEDALVVSEHQTRRRVMIDVLKQDSEHYLEILQTAVGNEDTETSHYAVSAIMEVKRKLMLALQELSVQYENDKNDVYTARTYADVLKGFMRSGFLDQRTLDKYQYTYISVLGQLIAISDDDEWAYRDKAETELKLGLLADAEATGRLYEAKYPLSEDAYLCLMKVYYETKSPDKLFAALDRLKQSPVRLSNRALTLVRFWSEGA